MSPRRLGKISVILKTSTRIEESLDPARSDSDSGAASAS